MENNEPPLKKLRIDEESPNNLPNVKDEESSHNHGDIFEEGNTFVNLPPIAKLIETCFLQNPQ